MQLKRPHSVWILGIINFFMGLYKIFISFLFYFFIADNLLLEFINSDEFNLLAPIKPLIEILVSKSSLIALIYSIFGIIQTFSAFFYFYGNNISRKILIMFIWLEYLVYIVLATIIFKLNNLHVYFNISDLEKALSQYYVWYNLSFLLVFIIGNIIMNYFITDKNSKKYCELKV